MVDVAHPAAGMSSLKDTLTAMSPEEITKFEKSFKDPKFMELLADYAKDISDPKARAEQEQYLRELEKEGRAQEVYGKGMQLVMPTPSFVAKTANSQSGQKVFINVCTSDKIAVATSKRIQNTDGKTKAGMHWDVPLLLSKCKEGSDRNRIECMVFDFVVHPDTCRMALNNARFKTLILDSAVDVIEKQMGWTLTRQYSFPKLAFKVTPDASQPATLGLRQDTQPGQTRSAAAAPQGPSIAKAHLAAQQNGKPLVTEVPSTSTSQAQDSCRGATSSGFRFPSARQPKQATADWARSQSTSQKTATVLPNKAGSTKRRQADASSAAELMTPVATTRMEAVIVNADAPKPAAEVGGAVVQPEYELVYRGQLDLAEAWAGPGIDMAPAKQPKELVVRIKLPGVQQAKQAQLNIELQQLTLSVAARYQLQLLLPYRVAEAEGTASFNSAKQQLEVVLPVLPSKLPAVASVSQSSQHQQAQQQQQASRHTLPPDGGPDQPSSSMADITAVADATAALSLGPGPIAAEADDSPSSSQSQQQGVADESTLAQQGSDRQPVTENQRKWLELHPKTSTSSTLIDHAVQPEISQAATAVDQAALTAAASAGHPFIASPAFGGQVPGYIFTSRDTGLGYYKDAGMVIDSSLAEPDKAAGSSGQNAQPSSSTMPFVLKPKLRSRAAAEELD